MKNHWPGAKLACLTFVLSAALATVWAGTGTLPPSSATTISAVRVAQSGRETTVRVEAGAPLVYQQMRLSNPPRVVLDFSNARLGTPANQVSSSSEPIRDVRLGQSAGDAVRSGDRSRPLLRGPRAVRRFRSDHHIYKRRARFRNATSARCSGFGYGYSANVIARVADHRCLGPGRADQRSAGTGACTRNRACGAASCRARTSLVADAGRIADATCIANAIRGAARRSRICSCRSQTPAGRSGANPGYRSGTHGSRGEEVHG
jgi:hypothetical protein